MQSLFLRRRFVILLLVLCPMLIMGISPQWASGMFTDFREYHSLQKSLSDLTCAHEEMTIVNNYVLNRIQVKEGIIDQLETGAISLHETAQKFLEIDRERPRIMEQQYSNMTSENEIEVASKVVLRYLRSRKDGGTALQPDSYVRVETEFKSEFGYQPRNLN